jgi:antitoxin VapB
LQGCLGCFARNGAGRLIAAGFRGEENLHRAADFSLPYATAYAYMWPMERAVKLFRNGRNQAVRIPREFELPGSDAIMRKEGDRLIIEPKSKPDLLALLKTLEPISDEFPEIDDALPRDVSL